MLIEPRPCAFCGRLFFSLDRNRKYCGPACLAEVARIQNAARHVRKPETPRQCPFCGKVFMAWGKRKFCCADCRKAWHRHDWQEKCQDARAVVAQAQSDAGMANVPRGTNTQEH